MLQRFLTGIFGSRNERILRSLNKTVAKINALEPRFTAMDDAGLRAMTLADSEEARTRQESKIAGFMAPLRHG